MSIESQLDALIAAVREVATALRAQTEDVRELAQGELEKATEPAKSESKKTREANAKAVAKIQAEPENGETELDLNDVTQALSKVAVKKGKDAVIKILAGFKVKTNRELKPEQYAAVIEKAQAVLQ